MKKLTHALALTATLAMATLAAGPSTAENEAPSRWYNGSLYEGGNGHLDLYLYAHTRYRYVGQCDGDCTDLDFTLWRWNGVQWEEHSRDHAPDDRPIVTVTPAYSTTYRLIINMESCSIEPCRYDVEVY